MPSPPVPAFRGKIRSFRPEKLQLEYGRLSDRAFRLHTIMSGCCADDEGRLVADAETLRVRAFGFQRTVTAGHVERLLRSLQRQGLVRLYSVNGTRFALVLDWDQRLDAKHFTASRLPPVPARAPVPPDTVSRPPTSRRSSRKRTRAARAKSAKSSRRAGARATQPSRSARKVHRNPDRPAGSVPRPATEGSRANPQPRSARPASADTHADDALSRSTGIPVDLDRAGPTESSAAAERTVRGSHEPQPSSVEAHVSSGSGSDPDPDRRGEERKDRTPPTPPHAGGQVVVLPDLALRAMRGRPPTPAFMAWWAKYPRQEGLLAAWRAWRRHGCEAIADQVLAAIEAQHPALQREGSRFAPAPARYLREGRWLDPLRAPARVLTPTTASNVDVLRRFAERGVGP